MEEKGQSKCRKDKDHDLWYGSRPPAVFRRVSCAVCRTGVGRNRIIRLCNGCKHWVHKKCSGIKCLAKDPVYRCTQCKGTACLLDSRPHREVQVGPDKPEVVASFYYLGDILSAADGCEPQHVKTTWKKFKELLLVDSSRQLFFKTCGYVYRCCV